MRSLPTPYWQSPCGSHVLYCADSRRLAHLFHVDVVITSPPYNCGKDYGLHNDNMPIDEYVEFLRETVFAADSCRFVVNIGQYVGSRGNRQLSRDLLALAARALPLVDEVIWDKGPANGAAWGNYPTSPRIRAQHESVFVFGDATMPNGNGLTWPEWSRLTTSIWRVSPLVDLSIHPAMMPEEIAIRCVSLWSDTKGTILDPFAGSGTTAVAAIHTGRKSISIERESKYCAIAKQRMEYAIGVGTLFDPQTIGLFDDAASGPVPGHALTSEAATRLSRRDG